MLVSIDFVKHLLTRYVYILACVSMEVCNACSIHSVDLFMWSHIAASSPFYSARVEQKHYVVMLLFVLYSAHILIRACSFAICCKFISNRILIFLVDLNAIFDKECPSVTDFFLHCFAGE